MTCFFRSAAEINESCIQKRSRWGQTVLGAGLGSASTHFTVLYGKNAF